MFTIPRRLLYSLTFITCLFSKVYAQEKEISPDLYKAATIPDSLKENSNAVIRYSYDEVTVKTAGQRTRKHHSLVTILNDKGDDEAKMVLFYNRKYTSISGIQMLVYSADGTLIKKYHKSDMYDGSASDGISIIIDDRFLGLKHTIASYPVTIDQTFEENESGYIDLGQWNIQEPEYAVQYASYKININPAVGFKYSNKNTTIKPVIKNDGTFDNYSWTVENLKPFKLEKAALSWQVIPHVSFSTNAFEYFGYPGELSSWKNFGKWQLGLNADGCSLSPERAEEIRKMTDTIKNDKDKARFLYKYLQQNMRYVSIQLGIGGLKPFPATFVDQKKYGDCKALSNYMYALLKAVNIPSYYALVRAGANEEPADTGFPHIRFNHVIICVPFKNDTTWLECTSSTSPFGKLGSFTENRNALLITEDGGKLVNTPKSRMEDNQFNSEVHIMLDAEGGAKAKLKVISTGGHRDLFLGLASIKLDEQKEYFIRNFNLKQPTSFEFQTPIDKGDAKEVSIDLDYDKFCEVAAGSKFFYRPRVFDLWHLTLPIHENRKSDYYFKYPMQESCVTTIDLPQGFEVEALPANANLKFSYGNYEITYNYDAVKNQVISTTKFNLTSHVIPAAKYAEMQQYMDNIAKAQNKKLIIHRKAA